MNRCPDCQVDPGQRHEEGCDVALCVVCGTQQLQCSPARNHDLNARDVPMQTWTGEWPGEAECREWGWYDRWTISIFPGRDGVPDSGPSVPCPPDHPHAHPALNRLAEAAARGEIEWSREHERYIALGVPFTP